jgi:hypothetical protein
MTTETTHRSKRRAPVPPGDAPTAKPVRTTKPAPRTAPYADVAALARRRLIGCYINRNWKTSGEAFITLAREAPGNRVDVAFFSVNLNGRKVDDCNGSLSMDGTDYEKALLRLYPGDAARMDIDEASACSLVRGAQVFMRRQKGDKLQTVTRWLHFFAPSARRSPPDTTPFSDTARTERAESATGDAEVSSPQDRLVIPTGEEPIEATGELLYVARGLLANFFLHEVRDDVREAAVDRFDPSGDVDLPDYSDDEPDVGEFATGESDVMRRFHLDWVTCDFAVEEGRYLADIFAEALRTVLVEELLDAMRALKRSHFDFYVVEATDQKRGGLKLRALSLAPGEPLKPRGAAFFVRAPGMWDAFKHGDVMFARVVKVLPEPVAMCVVGMEPDMFGWMREMLLDLFREMRTSEPSLDWGSFMKRRGHLVFTPLGQLMHGVPDDAPLSFDEFLASNAAEPVEVKWPLDTATLEAVRTLVAAGGPFRTARDAPRETWMFWRAKAQPSQMLPDVLCYVRSEKDAGPDKPADQLVAIAFDPNHLTELCEKLATVAPFFATAATLAPVRKLVRRRKTAGDD